MSDIAPWQTSAPSGHRHSATAALPLRARRHPLVAEIGRRLNVECNLTEPARIVVGVSGGADSLALLLALRVIRDHHRQGPVREVIAVHIHHHLRDAADEDAAYVAAICKRFGIAHAQRDIHPADEGGNLAAACRTGRYLALHSFAREAGASAIAVAHHADDQLETMLMAIARGTGLDGLAGMPWRSDVPHVVNGHVPLIRPLLASRKQDCESFCAAAEITWVDDPTNADARRARARLRRDVLPVLDELWPNAAVRAAFTADLLRAAAAAMEAKVSEIFGPSTQSSWSRDTLRQLPVAVIATGLRRAALAAMNETAEAPLVHRVLIAAAEAIADQNRSPRRFEIHRDLSIEVRAQTVRFHSNAEPAERSEFVRDPRAEDPGH